MANIEVQKAYFTGPSGAIGKARTSNTPVHLRSGQRQLTQLERGSEDAVDISKEHSVPEPQLLALNPEIPQENPSQKFEQLGSIAAVCYLLGKPGLPEISGTGLALGKQNASLPKEQQVLA